MTLTYAVVDDGIVEPTEFLSFAITGAGTTYTLGSPSSASGSIADNDTPAGAALWINSTSVTESDKGRPTVYVTLTVTRTGSTSGTSTVQWRTESGTATSGSDFVGASGMLTFDANETTKTITIEILADKKGEPNETFTIVLSNPGGTLATTLGASIGTVTIVDDDNKILAAGLPINRSGDPLDPTDASSALARAVATWIAIGGDPAVLSGVTLVIGDLPDRVLADTVGSTITIDADAAGWGWSLTSGFTSAAQIDLMSVLMHEIGHVFGYEHTAGGLMAETIEPGTMLWSPLEAAVDVASATVQVDTGTGAPELVIHAVQVASSAGQPVTDGVAPIVHAVDRIVGGVVHAAIPTARTLAPQLDARSVPLSNVTRTPWNAPLVPILLLTFGLLTLLRRRRVARP